MNGQEINTENSDDNSPHLFWVIVFIILIILLYYFSLGKINLFDKDEKNKRLIWIEGRLEFLYSDIKNKRELKEQLDKKVKKGFFYCKVGNRGCLCSFKCSCILPNSKRQLFR